MAVGCFWWPDLSGAGSGRKCDDMGGWIRDLVCISALHIGMRRIGYMKTKMKMMWHDRYVDMGDGAMVHDRFLRLRLSALAGTT